MPTFQQLVRKGRGKKKKKLKSRALLFGVNKLKHNKPVYNPAPFKR